MALASMMTGKHVSDTAVISELERSALKEIGVILSNAYLGALGSFVGVGLVPRVPEVIIDMAGAIVDYILIELSCKSLFALLIESEFKQPESSITGHFFLIPDPAGFELILRSIGNK